MDHLKRERADFGRFLLTLDALGQQRQAFQLAPQGVEVIGEKRAADQGPASK